MAIEHEIVKFVAEMELDAKTTAQFTQGLKDSNDKCAELRKTIVDTQKKLMEMKSAGKENSDAYKELEKDLGKYNTELKNASAHANKFASALGVNQMSMNQLKAYTKKLRNEMNSLHKETNPELWNKYNKKLKEAEKRMGELKGGSKSFSEILSSFSKKAGPAFAIAGSAITMVTGLINKAADTTQRWGDKFGILKAQSSAVIDHMVASITNWKNRSKASIKEVWDAAAEAQQLRDGLFEKENALKIEEAKAQKYIAEQEQIVNDSTKSAEERLRAQEKILDKEKELSEYRKKIATDSLDAALLDLKRTGLNQAQIEKLVDGYLKNEELFNDAKASMVEYNKKKEELENQLAEAVKTGDYNLKAELNMQLKELWGEYEDAYHIDNLIKKYDLGNDALVKAYVDARVQMEQADAQVEQAKATRMRKISQFVKQLQDEDVKRQEQVFNDKIQEADDAYSKELTDLKNSLIARKITEDEFREKSLAAEGVYLLKKKAILQAYGKDMIDIEGQIADWRLKAGIPDDNPNRPTTDLSVSGSLATKLPSKATSNSDPGIAKTFDMEMTALNLLHEAKAISEEEYLKKRNELYEKYGIEQQEQEQSLWDQGMAGKLQATQMMLDAMGQAVSSAKDAELTTLEAQMQAELAAAGENAEKREQIEAQYEAKKLDIQKKYADVDMGINIAKAIAAGALAIVETWVAAGGNPVLAGIFSALVAVTTAAQVATIIAQRNAIKNAAPGTGGGTSTTTRTVTGYSEGGYTGDGGRLEVAGVVHRGEYVVPQPEMRDPAVAAMVANIETRRRRRTSANALPGFAEGGYTGLAGGGRQTDDILNRILNAIVAGNDNPVPAYVVLSEANAKQETLNRFKKQTSLRR